MKTDFVEYDEHQFLITPELIQLMSWICQYESEAIKNIIARALSQGMKNNKLENYASFSSIDEMQHSLANFINMFEILLDEAINERARKNATQHNLLPALEQIDSSSCGESIIKSSLAMATSKIERNPSTNPKEIFFKELLKRWAPHKKIIQH